MRAPYKFATGDNSTGQCSGCGEVFFGESAFDRHRRGEEPGRYCIDPADPPLRRNGRPEEWWLDDRERWHLGRRMSDEARAALQAVTSEADRGQNDLPGVPAPGGGLEPPTGPPDGQEGVS